MNKPNQDIVETDQSNLDFPPIINPLKYIPIERIIELRKKHLSCAEIAKILGCSKPNIVQRLHKISEELDLTDHYVNNRSKILAFQQRRIIQSITDADLKKAGLRDKVISTGILFDKERLEEGKSTSIVFYADLIKAKQIVDQEIQEAEQIDNMSSNEAKTGI